MANIQMKAPRERHYTRLHIAAERNHTTLAQELLRSGEDPRAVDDHGNTPLHIACFFNSADVVQVLVDALGGPAALFAAHNEAGETPWGMALFLQDGDIPFRVVRVCAERYGVHPRQRCGPPVRLLDAYCLRVEHRDDRPTARALRPYGKALEVQFQPTRVVRALLGCATPQALVPGLIRYGLLQVDDVPEACREAFPHVVGCAWAGARSFEAFVQEQRAVCASERRWYKLDELCDVTAGER